MERVLGAVQGQRRLRLCALCVKAEPEGRDRLCRPYGTNRSSSGAFPNAEALGYCQPSLRDENRRMQTMKQAVGQHKNSVLRPLRRRVQVEPEATAFAFVGFDSRLATHAVHDFADEGEADAGALVAVVPTREHVEDTREH